MTVETGDPGAAGATNVAVRARQLLEGGPGAAVPLPSPAELAETPDGPRHQLLEGLRVELYAIASVVADAAVDRARREAPGYPPYGLVRSMHSETRLVLAEPDPVPAGAIDGFRALGKAALDTMVFHLDRQVKEDHASDRAWMLERLERMLTLFRIPAGPMTRSRMRNTSSFLYGGLHFGVSVCVQLAQAMSTVLDEVAPGLGPSERAAVLARSTRPAIRLAGLNIDHVVLAYQLLQAGGAPSGWMDAARLVVESSGGGPWRVELRHDDPLRGAERVPSATYATHGCPARSSPRGGPSAVQDLWAWCVDSAEVTGVLAGKSWSSG